MIEIIEFIKLVFMITIFGSTETQITSHNIILCIVYEFNYISIRYCVTYSIYIYSFLNNDVTGQ